MLDEKWTIEKLLAVEYESGSFERKRVDDRASSKTSEYLAKALSAFANSDGGHLVLGVDDDGKVLGLDKDFNDRLSTKEWLEQKIATLLVPELRDFEVYPVECEVYDPALVNKVVIVIDVGKSDLAPHQSTADHHYYVRFGSHSKPAPHRHLELLFRRDRFPGPEVGKAWVHSVINPMLNTVRREKELIRNEKWGVINGRTDHISSAERIIPESITGNMEQFFEYNKGFRESIEEHDRLVGELVKIVVSAHDYISQILETSGKYDYIMSLDKLEPLKDPNKCAAFRRFEQCESQQDFIRELFGSDDKRGNSRLLAQYMMNRTEPNSNSNVAPFWDLYRKEFVDLIERYFEDSMKELKACGNRLLEVVEFLEGDLEKTRKDIAFKFSIPYDP